MRPTIFTRALPLFVAALAAPVLRAHPGHSLSEGNWSHLLTSPDHLLTLGLIGAALVILGAFVSKPRVRATVRVAGASMIVAALAAWGFTA